MGRKPPLTASAILVMVCGIALQIAFKETGAALFVEGLVEQVAHYFGYQKAPVMALIANLALLFGVMAVGLYAAYRIGANERVLGYAPHIDMPLYEAARMAYGGVRKLKGVATEHSEMLSNKIDNVITWYCNALTRPRDSGKPLVDLYGCRLPSDYRELVEVTPDRVFVVRDGNKVVLKDQGGYGEFHNLLVRKSEIKKSIKIIASWGGENAAKL